MAFEGPLSDFGCQKGGRKSSKTRSGARVGKARFCCYLLCLVAIGPPKVEQKSLPKPSRNSVRPFGALFGAPVAHEAPKGPKMLQKATPKWSPKCQLRTPSCGSRCLALPGWPRASKCSILGAILESFWEPFWLHFGVFRIVVFMLVVASSCCRFGVSPCVCCFAFV